MIINKADLWWHPRHPEARSLWESTIEVGENLFREILAHPVPLDLRVLRKMKRSPLGVDLFLWLTYRTHGLRRTTELSWWLLYSQFGARPGEATSSVVDNFRRKCNRELVKLRAAWPELRAEAVPGHLKLSPSRSRVQRREITETL